MKIALLSREYPPDTAWGGLATLYGSLAPALVRRGHEVHVICQAVNEPGDDTIGGVLVHRVGTNPRRYGAEARVNYSLHARAKLADVVNRYGIDIVEATHWGAEGLLYGLRKRTPLVVRLDVSASDLLKTNVYLGTRQRLNLAILSRFENAAVGLADRVIAISRETYDWALERRGIERRKVDLVYHGIDTVKCRFVESSAREELAIPPEAPMALFAGRIEMRKGVGVLCQAIPTVLTALPAAKFVFAGGDTNTAPNRRSLKAHLVEHARRHGFANSLVFVDSVSTEELVRVYSACDVFVLPSFKEGFSMSILEALACGKPVVATVTGGARDIGLEPPNGVLVAPGDVQELATAMVRLLSLAEGDKRHVATQNRELVERRYSVGAWAENVLQVYARALGDEGT